MENNVIILVKGDHHFYDADFNEVVIFKDQRPHFIERDKPKVIFLNYEVTYYDLPESGTALIQNDKFYSFDSKVKEIVLENGKRYRFD